MQGVAVAVGGGVAIAVAGCCCGSVACEAGALVREEGVGGQAKGMCVLMILRSPPSMLWCVVVARCAAAVQLKCCACTGAGTWLR